MTAHLPLVIVTGFLGSGKTTLVQRLLRDASAGGTGVVVNEFGEIGLDHTLMVHADEKLELVDGGCMCCARRPDIARAVRDLVVKARRSGDAGLDRLLIETTGLADPSPIVSVVGKDPWMRANIRLAGVICVLDAVNGPRTLAAHPEASRQIAIADTVVVTKTDMRGAARLEALAAAAHAVAPDVRVLDAQSPELDIAEVFSGDDGMGRAAVPGFAADDPAHASAWTSFVLPFDRPIDWPAFTLWLSALLHAHGSRILRVKGLIRTTASRGPLVVHGVQHVVYPPRHMNAEDDRGQPGFLVFITRDVARDQVARSLDGFLSAVDKAAIPVEPSVARADTPRALDILTRAGVDNPPMEGDALPQ